MPRVSAEKFVRDWLATRFPSARVVTETPPNLADVTPCIKVSRVSGSGDLYSFDQAVIDFEFFDKATPTSTAHAVSRDGALEVADALVSELPEFFRAGTFVHFVRETQSPVDLPYGNPNLSRHIGTVEVRLHTRPQAA